MNYARTINIVNKKDLLGLFTGLLISFGCSYPYGRDCDSIKWKEFHVIGSEETAGNVMLSVRENGEIFNKLNTLILSTSEYLLDDISSNEVLSESVMRSRFSDTEVAAEKPDLFYELQGSVLFCFKELLCYKVRAETIRSADKGSPYFEYLNVNSHSNSIIRMSDVIDIKKQQEFIVFLLSYAEKDKKIVIEHYKNLMSERISDIYAPLDEFSSSNYSLQKVSIRKTDTISMISLQKAGVEFRVEVTDENFEDYKESSGHAYVYESSIIIPYKFLEPFVNKRSGIFNTLKWLSDNG